jgi:hypothetical protein
VFNPSRDQARRFFIDAWQKFRAREALTPLEQVAADLAQLHPEYHAVLEDPDSADRDFSPEDGKINPFLHLSLHLAVHEQLTIDQPPGLRGAYDACLSAKGDRHAALHDVIESLGETIWQAQRSGEPLDAAAYVEAVHRRSRSSS